MWQTKYMVLESAMHYVCDRASRSEVALDPIKLNKVLWFADVKSYIRNGMTITKARYMRKPHGPVVKARDVAMRNLTEGGFIRIKHGNDGIDRFQVVIDWVPGHLLPSQTEVLDEMLAYVGKQSTSQVSERTHGEIWKAMPDGREIPLHMVFAEGAQEPSPEMLALAKQAA